MRGGHNKIDITGRRFGMWTVVRLGEPGKRTRADKPGERAHWLCRCDCGKEGFVASAALRRGTSKSCGCERDRVFRTRYRKHGHTRVRRSASGLWVGSAEYEMLRGAKYRAKTRGVPFDLTLTDIVIPARCPVLDIPLVVRARTGFPAPDSPSLDRIIPARGYVKNNVRVISHKANTLKRDATIEELEKIIAYMRRETK